MERWGWAVLVAKFFQQFVLAGYFKCLGLSLPTLVQVLDSDYATICFLITLMKTMYYICCPFVQVLSNRYDGRLVAVFGNLIASVMVIVMAFTRSTVMLGILLCVAGCGSSTLNQVGHVTLHQYFGPKFGSANSLTLLGSIVGSLVLPYVMVILRESYGIWGAILCLGGILAHLVPIAFCMREPMGYNDSAFERLDAGASNGDERNLRTCGNYENDPGSSSSDGQLSHKRLKGQPTSVHKSSEDQSLEESPEMEQLLRENNIIELKDTPNSQHLKELQNSDSNATPNSNEENKSVIRTLLDMKSVRYELTFTLTLIPSITLCLMIFGGWVFFLVAYGVSENMDESRAVFLPMAGAAGGIVGRALLVPILHWNPDLSTAMLGLGTLISAAGLLLYQVSNTFTNMMLCSFVTGLGVYSTIPSFFGVLGTAVKKEHVPGIMALQFFTCGISNALAGYLCGKIYDVTNSFHAVFFMLGSSMFVAFILVVCFYFIQRRKTTEDR